MSGNSWGDASVLLAEAGVEEDRSYYGSFTADDERAVLSVAMRVQAAWLTNDADAFASVFADNGSLLMGDRQLMSRDEIHEYMSEGFEGPLRGAHVKGWPLTVSFLSDDVAVAVTDGGIIYAGEDDIAPERKIRASWIIRKKAGGGLELMSHQSCPVS